MLQRQSEIHTPARLPLPPCDLSKGNRYFMTALVYKRILLVLSKMIHSKNKCHFISIAKFTYPVLVYDKFIPAKLVSSQLMKNPAPTSSPTNDINRHSLIIPRIPSLRHLMSTPPRTIPPAPPAKVTPPVKIQLF